MNTLRLLLTLFTILYCTTIAGAAVQEAHAGVAFEKACVLEGKIVFTASLDAPGSADDLVKVRSYTDDAGKAGISNDGALRSDSWLTVPEDIPSRAGHLQIEEILEIQPGRGSHYLEFDVPRSYLRFPNNGTHTSGGARQFQLNDPVEVDPSTFRRPPGRPKGS